MSLIDEIAATIDTQQRTSTSPSIVPRPQDPLAPFKLEVTNYAAQLSQLRYMGSDEAMAWVSSVSARVMQLILTTLDYDNRASTKWRVEALIPMREELRFQFQVASRRHAISELEWKLAGGQES